MAIEIDSPFPGFEVARAKLNDNLRAKLWRVYTNASKMEGFPKDCCGRVSRDVRRLGFAFREGSFLLDLPKTGETRLEYHMWNEGLDGRIIDLTAAQFNPWLSQPLPLDVLIFEPKDPNYQRYHVGLDLIEAEHEALNRGIPTEEVVEEEFLEV